MHEPLHAVSVPGQLMPHTLFPHTRPDAQTFPHVPQLWKSLLNVTQMKPPPEV